MEFRHALVIGKFYPPHAGHEYLIRSAATFAARVTVVVMAADRETIPLDRRVAFLRESFAAYPAVTISGVVDNLPVDYDDDAIWSAQVALMRDGIALADQQAGRQPIAVDAVVSSEPYGDELARRFDAVPVCLDRPRLLYPVSGTAVRRDPAGNWEMLAPAVRAYLTHRVVIIGAESTGKTTLAGDLRDAYRARGGIWARTNTVPEHGREYAQNLFAVLQGKAQASQAPAPRIEDIAWHSGQFREIAATQIRLEEAMARDGSPVVICDTDALATCLWHARHVGGDDIALAAVAASQAERSLYLLTDIAGMPFVQDGWRDGEQIRHDMHRQFIDRLSTQAAPWALISGAPRQRVVRAMELIDSLPPYRL